MLCHPVSTRLTTAARRPVVATPAALRPRTGGPLTGRSSRSPVLRRAGEPTGSSSSSSSTPSSSGKLPAKQDEEEFVGLLPEEDQEIPGNYFDALNRNTKLGKAVAAAVEDIQHLNKMEMESLKQADELLKKLGLKGSLFGDAGLPPAPVAEEEEEEGAAGNN